MTGMTSGRRAVDGLGLANHDKEPWAYRRNSKTGPGPFGTPDRAATRIDKAMLWFPRPEFDVPENGILLYVRRSKDRVQLARQVLDAIQHAPHRLDMLIRWPVYYAEREHARRVLERWLRLQGVDA